MMLLRRRRDFENSEAEKECEGARLDGFLAESEGPIRDPDLSNFAKDYQFSSLESGSGQPPDRAQICPLSAVQDFFL